MVEFAYRVRGYVEGMTLAEFEGNQEKQDAVTYRVGVIGEAARNVSTDTADSVDLDWRGITGMRNRLFHGYGEVDVNLLWKTVMDYLPPMIATLERYLSP
jgi:uncharacterized protein with HEPN domain